MTDASQVQRQFVKGSQQKQCRAKAKVMYSRVHSIPCGMPISGHETKTKDFKTARTTSHKQHLEGMPQKCAQTRPMTCGRQRSPAGTRYACSSQRTVTIPSFGVAVGSTLGACPCIGGAGRTCAPRGSLAKPVDESRDMARRGSQAGPKVSPALAPTSPAVGSDLCSGRPDQSLGRAAAAVAVLSSR